MASTGISTWSTTAANNSSALLPGEGISASDNPTQIPVIMRQHMVDIKTQWLQSEWFDVGVAPTRTGNTTFTMTGDQTAYFIATRAIKCVDSSTLYGSVVSSSYNGAITTVTVLLTSGSLSASLTQTYLGSVSTGNSLPSTTGSSEWATTTYTATRTANTTFTLVGDQTALFLVNQRVKCNDSSTIYGVITASAFSSVTTVTIRTDTGSLSASLTTVQLSIQNPTNLSAPFGEIDEWQPYGYVATRTGNTTCTVATDITASFGVGQRVKCLDSSTLYGTIITSSFSNPTTTLTISLDSGNLSASLTKVTRALLSPTNISIPTAYKLPTTQVFTSSGTFTVPGGITAVISELWGGGGGGGGNQADAGNSWAGGGGGGAGYSYKKTTGLTAGQTITVTIGAGGAGGATQTNGSAGGTTSFDSYHSATGGSGGLKGQSGGVGGGAGGNGGVGSSGDLNFQGSPGASSILGNGISFTGAFPGGMSPRGAGSVTNGINTPGTAGQPGGGGAGAPASPTTGLAGGTGGAGMVVVYY